MKKCNLCHVFKNVKTYWQPILNADIELCDDCADAILRDNPRAIEKIMIKDENWKRYANNL